MSFPSEPDFFQAFFPIKSNCVIVISTPLIFNPNPWRLVLLALGWHDTMAILLFELNQFFMLQVSALAVWFEASHPCHISKQIRLCPEVPFGVVEFCFWCDVAADMQPTSTETCLVRAWMAQHDAHSLA
jgi:hypothetical protein